MNLSEYIPAPEGTMEERLFEKADKVTTYTKTEVNAEIEEVNNKISAIIDPVAAAFIFGA